jgi:hypothetical protein
MTQFAGQALIEHWDGVSSLLMPPFRGGQHVRQNERELNDVGRMVMVAGRRGT